MDIDSPNQSLSWIASILFFYFYFYFLFWFGRQLLIFDVQFFRMKVTFREEFPRTLYKPSPQDIEAKFNIQEIILFQWIRETIQHNHQTFDFSSTCLESPPPLRLEIVYHFIIL